jgi:hypothetical protein
MANTTAKIEKRRRDMSMTQVAYNIVKNRIRKALDLKVITIQQYNQMLNRVAHSLAIVPIIYAVRHSSLDDKGGTK